MTMMKKSQQILLQTPPSRDSRRQFYDDINILSKGEQEEIFRIIKKNNVSFSENSNGVFFDIATLDDDIFEKLQTFMNFCKEQRRSQAARDKQLEELREEIAGTIGAEVLLPLPSRP